MGDLVGLPLWALLPLCALAAVGLYDRILKPLARLLLAARRERAISSLNQRLALPIAPFKLARRRELVAQLMLDPAVEAAIATEAATSGLPRREIQARAARYAREIVPAFNATIYFRFGTRMARWLSTALYRVRVGASDIAALQAIEPGATVVFVINHRSNMDYVLVTYLAARSSALSYAVGEWARVPVLKQLIKLMGGYFIRRGSGNELYRRVLSRYVHIATASGVTQAVFPEGGLSRDGRLQPARMGLIAYMVGDFDPSGGRDIAFVPVGLNYDRVLEDRVLIASAATLPGEKPRFAFKVGTFLGFAGRTIFGRLVGRWYRNGYACVSFGKPLSLRAYMSERALDFRTMTATDRTVAIAALASALMVEVGRAVPALPVSLVAAAILAAGEHRLTTLELKHAVATMMIARREQGLQVYLPRADDDYAVEVGLRMLVLRRIVETRLDGLIDIVAGQQALLAYYAAAISAPDAT